MRFPSWGRAIVLALSLMGVVGCSSVKDTYVTPTASNEAYMNMSAQERAEYDQRVTNEDVVITRKNDVEFKAGRPVHYGDARSGYTVQWAKRTNAILFFPGHTTGAFGQESQSILSVAADEEGKPVIRQGQPIVLFASTSHQEGLGRAFVRGFFQVLGAGANGALAAQIVADRGNCGNNCGGGGALAIATTASSANQAIQTGVNVAVGSTRAPGGHSGYRAPE